MAYEPKNGDILTGERQQQVDVDSKGFLKAASEMWFEVEGVRYFINDSHRAFLNNE